MLAIKTFYKSLSQDFRASRKLDRINPRARKFSENPKKSEILSLLKTFRCHHKMVIVVIAMYSGENLFDYRSIITVLSRLLIGNVRQLITIRFVTCISSYFHQNFMPGFTDKHHQNLMLVP